MLWWRGGSEEWQWLSETGSLACFPPAQELISHSASGILSLLCLSPSLLMLLRVLWLCGGSVGALCAPAVALCPLCPHCELGDSTTLLCRDAPRTNPAEAQGKTHPAWINWGEKSGIHCQGMSFRAGEGRHCCLLPEEGCLAGSWQRVLVAMGMEKKGDARMQVGVREKRPGTPGGELLPFSVFLMGTARLGEVSG